ncbi:MAG TPA: HutP family protein [Clostridia bacterium]|jgi:hypothetical protein|nr:MAG: HutP [Firmicutes bacterium ADurb.Bin099]HHT95487.1 hut operon positive regulator HutP [Clostridiaceae bacterium]HOF26038.1 HutP family protein [Clostridia bacterium]HOM33519.1 HutP family protein [Clostridia bacterium]HOR89215.1 HutP family protein [Clostridia bacterium]
MENETIGSKDTSKAAIRLSVSSTREEEYALIKDYAEQGIKCVAVDFGGDFISSVSKIIERAVVASKRQNVIRDVHHEQGAVVGATREALGQIMPKAIGCNIGGKIGIARYKEHITVAVFTGIGFLNLDEVGIGLGHRSI